MGFNKIRSNVYLGSQRFLPVSIWHFQEDPKQELNCFSARRHGDHVGPQAQREALCEVALGSGHYALFSISEVGEKGRWQLLLKVLKLEETQGW